MSQFTNGRGTFAMVRRELRARTRLLAAAFARSVPTQASPQAFDASTPQSDLLSDLNLAGQAAGLQVWHWDLVTNTLKFDRTLMDRYGGDVEDAEANPGTFIARAVHPEDLAHYRREFIRALKGQAPLCIDYRVLHKDGSTHPVQLRGQVFRGPAANGQPGRAIRVVGFTVDMRSQLESAKRLVKQHEHQQLLIARLTLAAEAAGIGVWDWDLKTDQLRSDSNMAHIFDQAGADSFPTAQAFTAMIVHPDDLSAFRQAMDDVVQHGERVSHRYRQIRTDGSLHHVQLHGRVIRNADNQPERLLAITWDITQEVEAQTKIEQQAQQLRQWLERIGLASETAGIGMWDWDLATGKLSSDTNMSGIFRDADLTGVINAPDFIAKILHPDDRAPFTATIRAAVAPDGGDRVSTNFRYFRSTGGVHHVELHGRIVRNEHGHAIRFLGISWNVTAKVEAQAEIERQSAAQHALLERSRLAAQVAGIDIWEWDLLSDRFTADAHMTVAYGDSQVVFPSGRALIERIVHPDDLATYQSALQEAVKSADSLTHGYRMVLGDGSVRHIKVHARIFRNADGKAERVLGISLNRSDEIERHNELRRQAEEERALRDRLNLATETARIAIWDQDMVTGQFTGDTRFWQLFGIDTPEPSFRVQDGIHPDVRKEALTPIYAALSDPTQNEVLSIRHRTTNTKRNLQYVQSHMRMFRNSSGQVERLLGVTWDVTDEVQANEALRNQAEKERALVERLNITTQAAGIAPWEFDLKSGQFSWHGQRLACFGLDHVPLDQYYETLATIVLPEDRQQLSEPGRDAIENNRDSYEYRFRVNGIDGKVHHIHNYARVLRDERGKIRYCVGVTWDVTKEVEASEQLKKQAELERTLLDRLNVATQAAGISPWEFELRSRKLTWLGIPLKAIGLDGVPIDQYMAELRKRILPEDLAILDEAAEQAIASGAEVYSYRYRANGIDGQVHHMKNFVRIQRSARGTPYKLVGVTWDISEEVAASERLEEQVQHAETLRERLGIATMAAGISPFEIDLTTGKFLWVENPIKALRGTSGKDGKLAKFSERIHPEDVNCLRDEIVRAAKGGYDVITYRYRGIAADGGIVHVQTHAKLYFNEQRRATRALGVSWDVTKEIAAAAQLHLQAEHERRLLERLNIATDSAGISTWEIDLVAAKFLWIENRIKTIAYENDDNLTLAFYTERILPEDRKLMPNAIRAALSAKSDRIGFRYRAVGNKGAIVHVQTFARLIVDNAGRPVRILGVSWDVTREMEAAEQLRHQTERLRDVERRLERASLSSSEGHWEAELGSGHLWCSSSFHTLLGYAEGELEARVSAFDHLVHPDDHRVYHDALHGHLINNAPYDVEARMRMGGGQYRWFRMRGMAERDADNQATVMAGSIHDVHQQKIVEDALNLAQRRFERAINGTQDGLWELDVTSDVMWCSPRLSLLLGYSATQLESGNFLRSLIHPEDAAKVSKITESHYRHNTPFDLEVRLRMRNGDYRWYRARATADRDANGWAVRLSGSLQDVTEARAAREELVRATEAAEMASRAKSAFLANVSHEIRTPMNGIIGMTGLLLDMHLDRTQRDYANTIRGSADSLLTVINDILDFSKIEAGKLDLENIELDLRANVEDVGVMMAFQAANKDLELIVNVHPDVPEFVLGDPQRIRQCLINLVGNAIKFTKRGEIVVDVCAVGRHEGRVLTHFEVRDTGMGIPDTTLKTLFQPFVQADSSTTRHFGGTGLGLSIVRRLVEMMGGQVGVVSRVGEGSTFFFTLSLEPKEDVTVRPAMPTSSGGHILIVDDNATNRRVLEGLLVYQGYQVSCAASGAAALELLQSSSVKAGDRRIDMVITDFQMPDMDGLMLGERIASDPSLAHLRMVMLTSLDRQGDSKHLAALGFAAYLTKPVRARELRDCVTHVLNGDARQWQMEMRPMLTRTSLSQVQSQQRFAGHVLLVEDNLVNQKVAARILERMGCTVRIAHHGQDGVAAFAAERFAIVLMDLQMPVMDGIAAARAIRKLEGDEPARLRTPIIALTANAMRGDQERCEAAGMDGFLTKPIEIERLRDMLTKLGMVDLAATGRAPVAQSVGPSESDCPRPPVDLARLNEITDGDAEFAKELVATFVASGEEQLAEIEVAIGSMDREALARTAHKLKGACANIYADDVRKLAARIEEDAVAASATELHAASSRLQQEFARARDFLNDPSVVPAPIKAVS